MDRSDGSYRKDVGKASDGVRTEALLFDRVHGKEYYGRELKDANSSNEEITLCQGTTGLYIIKFVLAAVGLVEHLVGFSFRISGRSGVQSQASVSLPEGISA